MTTLKTPHKHAALIKQWVDDTSQPVWVWSTTREVWDQASKPFWYEDYTYALGDKPTSPPKRMCVLAGVEFPAPETKAPPMFATYFRADIADTSINSYYVCEWDGSAIDQHRLESGLVHLTREAAMQHAKALLAANKAAVTTKE